MAVKATIFKADLQVADIERNYYADHALTLARHPSETDERMMVRLMAFVLHAHENLEFGRGLSTDNEPALWRKDLTGAIELWIEVGLPAEKLVRKTCGRAAEVVIYSYGGRAAGIWYEQNRNQLERLGNLTIIDLPPESTRALAKLAQRTMRLQCTIQDGQVRISDSVESVQVERVPLKVAQPGLR